MTFFGPDVANARCPSPLPPPPAPGIVYLRSGSLQVSRATSNKLVAMLNQKERARAARFLLAEPAARFCVARGYLRLLLGQCLAMAPKDVPLAATTGGKPYLLPRSGQLDLRFNLSHSGDLCAIAIALGCDIGIDIESTQRAIDLAAIEPMLLMPSEIRSLPADLDRRRIRVLSLWTRKEALIKARGQGAGSGARELEVLEAPATPPAWSNEWEVRSFAPGLGYVGSLAIERKQGIAMTIDHWPLPEPP